MMKSNWDAIESQLFEYYKGENSDISHHLEFLESINFLDDNGDLTETARRYLDSKFLYDNDEHVLILRNEILNLREIRELCQSYYGQKTQRRNVEWYFKSKTSVSDDTEVGRILVLLNKVDIVDYSKRDGTVQFKETDEVEEEDQESYRITRRTPYSNLVRFRKALRSCSGDVFWIDRHFTKKGLEPLAEELTGDQYDSIKILTGPSHVSTHMRDDFKRFIEEMENRGIDAELRVVTDEDWLRGVHDRWILSSNGPSWNVPPINSIYGNQESELHQTEEEIDFEGDWGDAADIIEDWNDIQKYID